MPPADDKDQNCPRHLRAREDFGDDLPAHGADAGGDSVVSALIWVVLSIVGMVLIGGGVFLAWHLALDANQAARRERQIAQVEQKPAAPVMVADEKIAAQAENSEEKKPAPETKQVESADPPPPEVKKEEPRQDDLKKEDTKEKPSQTGVPNAEAPKAQGKNPEGQPNEPPKDEPPKDEIIIGADGWYEVNCIQGRFRVALPALPDFEPVDDPKSKHAGRGYLAKHPQFDLVFRASARQVEGNGPADAWTEHLMPMVMRHLLAGDAKIIYRKDIVQHGHRGQELLAMAAKKKGVAGRFFQLDDGAGKSRIFFFTVAGQGVRLDYPDVRRFLNSVKFEKDGVFLAKKESSQPAPGQEKAKSLESKATAIAEKKRDPEKAPQGARPADTRSVHLNRPEAKGVAGPPALMAGDVGKIAGKLNSYLGAVIDLEAKSALLLLPAGQAKLYDYPDFRALGTYKLAAGTAYHAIYEKARGRLVALTPNFRAKDPAGKAGGSQVVVYEIRLLLDGKLNAQSELAAVKTIALGGFCSQLCLSPDGAVAYVLETSNAKALKVLRVNIDKGEIVGGVTMPEFTDTLRLARDGKALYALSHLTARSAKGPPPQGAILLIDPEAMKVRKTVHIGVDPFDMDASTEGIVFVSGYGGVRGEITVVDAGKETPVVATWKGVPPGSCLKLSGDERRLFVGNWKGTLATVAALAIPETLEGSDLPKAQWAQSPPVSARGDMTISPDNHYLLCDSGVVFFLKNGE